MEKINVAELLRDCPAGMELDCTMFNGVFFAGFIDKAILIKTNEGITLNLTSDGCWDDSPSAKCVIFPKGKTTWEGFVPPCKFKVGNWYQCTKDLFFGTCVKCITFDKNAIYYCAQEGCLQDEYGRHIAINKDLYDNFKLWTIQDAKEGDVLAFNDEIIVIFKDLYNKTSFHSYCHIEDGIFTISKEYMPDWWEGRGFYPATKEQCNLLFQAIKDHGYTWNTETKTLEKLPKFKVGDRVKKIATRKIYVIGHITESGYVFQDEGGIGFIFGDEHIYELVPDKFDITTLKPFESRVLVRTKNFHDKWTAGFFSHKDSDMDFAPFWTTADKNYQQCIPYEGNEHLLGKTDDCNEYFKTWE